VFEASNRVIAQLRAELGAGYPIIGVGGVLSGADAQAKLARIQKARTTNIRISDKGAVSIYGLGRFPVTLYADQWRMLQ
jgi:hypothetical protein